MKDLGKALKNPWNKLIYNKLVMLDHNQAEFDRLLNGVNFVE